MDYLREDAESVQWALSSPTSCASPIEFAVGSSQWSLKPIADSSCRQTPSIATPGDVPPGAGPQWTFQHVDSTLRNTILSPTRVACLNLAQPPSPSHENHLSLLVKNVLA
ncbi:hypothetical protein RSOLAG1IB_04938 [Rhizoctonia solani AG-1 IB]|uniref:Uncharacterized protein n=1 Tax=Thanatephorus cucumeris (strain AG1-IB / isolate 7/3/14) TaxID=1108050 RepID=A0A0B7G2C9_THACB|nr:hypothetical protein RSOLAG1IB_04938 [Rhizoctonia solani AG-1 IB]